MARSGSLWLLALALAVQALVVLSAPAVSAADPIPLGLGIGADQPTLDRKTGQVTITGFLNCSEAVQVVVTGEIIQQQSPAGRTSAGRGSTTVQCVANTSGDELTPYSLTIVGEKHRFRPGTARMSVYATACVPAEDGQGCAKYGEASFSTVVELR